MASERLDMDHTNELLTRGEQWMGMGGAQAPGGGTDGVQVKVHRTGCRCGWKSTWRATRGEAHDDAVTHQREGCRG